MADDHRLGSGEPHPLDVLALVRLAAKRHHYALAIHGSLSRDLDLIAVPWKECASEPAVLVEAIRKAVDGMIFVAEPDGRDGYYGIDDTSKHSPMERPHGRVAWSIYGVLGGAYLDLSVMPLHAALPARKVNGSATETAHRGVMPLYGEPLVGLEPTTAPVSDPGRSSPTPRIAPPDDLGCPAHHGVGAPKNHPETSTQPQRGGRAS